MDVVDNKSSPAASSSNTRPAVPEGWDRCHAYNERKRRFCRQTISPSVPPGCIESRPRYCGNHVHLYAEDARADSSSSSSPALKRAKRDGNDDDDGSADNHFSNGTKRGRLAKEAVVGSKGRRVPCPIDPSHTVYESALLRHMKVCPLARQRAEESCQPYYRCDVNRGGHGEKGRLAEDASRRQRSEGAIAAGTTEWAQRLALAVLRAYARLFLMGNDDPRSITEEEIYNSVPQLDLSGPEDDMGLSASVAHLKIKAGGPRHIRQIGSIVGHLRRCGLFPPLEAVGEKLHGSDKEKYKLGTPPTTAETTVLEMGAGRGMLGLVAAGALSAQMCAQGTSNSVDDAIRLVMVEKAGTRGKAETTFRRATRDAREIAAKKGVSTSVPAAPNAVGSISDSADGGKASFDHSSTLVSSGTERPNENYLNLDDVSVMRIKCDLAHVHLPSALPSLLSNRVGGNVDGHPFVKKGKTLAIAKHLCGAGTDLALKSLRDVCSSVDGCVLATCCHGLCSWDDYVGRDYLRVLIESDQVSKFEDSTGRISAVSFGKDEFNMMKRWTSGSVLDVGAGRMDQTENGESGSSPASKSQCSVSGSNADAVTISLGNASTSTQAPQEDACDSNNGDDGLEHQNHTEEDDGDCLSISSVVRKLHLSCGQRGLGRACQRLIDYGRCQYIEQVLYGRQSQVAVDMCHYVDQSVTPQNALIVSYRKR